MHQREFLISKSYTDKRGFDAGMFHQAVDTLKYKLKSILGR
jgi:hypothetical protein